MYVLLLIAVLGLATACTGGEATQEAAASSSAEAEKDKSQQVIAQAQLQAAQYDYDGALATLATDSSDEVKAEVAKVQQAKAQAVQWPDNTTVTHIFYHSLIVDPSRAFANGSEGIGFSQYMVTLDEFTKQLQQIYDNGYVLVHPQRLAAPGPDGAMTEQPIVLPPGKKPLVLSLDDVNYYEYMMGKGFATNLTLADDGRVVNTYTDASGKTTEGNYDVIPIVDEFVKQHPDFAYKGDKGSVGVTGYNGLLGYRSSVQSYGDNPTTKAEAEKAKKVADAIKANGWTFASHTWGHINMTKAGMGSITTDSALWKAEVGSLVGKTDELLLPYGADVSDIEPYSMANQKFAYLYGTEGFRYISLVDGSQPYWMQLGTESLRMARINIDGLSMQKALDGTSKVLPALFDTASTVDPKRPLPVPSVGGPKAGGG